MSLNALVLGFFLLIGPLAFIIGVISRPKSGRNSAKLPPGPWGMPIIGYLHKLGTLPHHTMTNLAKKYGPIMSIKLGNVRTIVISSPSAAELFLKTHDYNFASRPKSQAVEIMSYGSKTIALQPYGQYWRNIRKLCVIHLLTPSKVEDFKPIRTEEIRVAVNHLKKAAEREEMVNVSKVLAELFENMLYRVVLGRGNNDDGMKVSEHVEEILHLVGAFNISDYLPWLSPFDLQGLYGRMKRVHKAMDIILENIIKEHEIQNTDHKPKDHKDFVDVLLSLVNQFISPQDEKSEILSRTHIKAILQDMIVAAHETSTIAVVWIFSEILKNPRVMRKLHIELETIVGMNKMVEENDLPKLTYLDMIIKEGLRLHPVAPFLIPHESMENVVVDGFYIPRKSRILFNVWSMGRDPTVWSSNAKEFYPERFENDDIDIQGQDFRHIPFGSGRRRCPGMQMGLLNVRLVLGQLVHCFEWKMPDGMAHEELDMDEKFSLSLGKANDVFSTPIYRLKCLNSPNGQD